MSNDGGGVVPPTAPAPVDFLEYPQAPTQFSKPPADSGVLKPGVIPLRPLTLGDIFNGAVNYIRANPKATLGLTAIVVVIAQLITLAINVVPLASTGSLGVSTANADSAAVLASLLSSIGALVATTVTGVLLSGMLTVVIGRAVFGSTITIGEAWAKLRPRLLPLIGLALLELVVMGIVIGIIVGFVIAVMVATGIPAIGILLGFFLGMLLTLVLIYLYTMVSFAAPLVVLERMGVFASIGRSFALIRRAFWRVLGIRALATIVAFAITFTVAGPFQIAGSIITSEETTASTALIGFGLLSLGGAISQILTAPFNAGVVVFLYTDRRIRWEAFDLVLQSGAATADPNQPDSTDHLWLVRQP